MCVYQIFYLPSCWLVQLLLATEEGLGFGPFLYQKSEPPSLLLEHSVSRQCPPPPPPLPPLTPPPYPPSFLLPRICHSPHLSFHHLLPTFFLFLEHPTPLLSNTRMFHSTHIASSYAISTSPSLSTSLLFFLLEHAVPPSGTYKYQAIWRDQSVCGQTFIWRHPSPPTLLPLLLIFTWVSNTKPTQLPSSKTLSKFSC